MIDQAERERFAAEVTRLRDEGWTWPEISELTGRSERTCKRALDGPKPCKHRGCPNDRLLSGLYCTEHAKAAMRNKPGQGDRQQQVLRLMRKHGYLTSAQLQQMTGLQADHVSQITGRLLRLGLIERPMPGHYTMPRPDEMKPVEPTPITPFEKSGV